jgi:hypothetical protein
MGLTLVLEVHTNIIYSLCTYIQYSNLSMYKFRPLFLWHVFMLYTFRCMLVHTQPYCPKIIQYQICSCKHDQDSCKWQLVACQLHNDWLQMIRFLVMKYKWASWFDFPFSTLKRKRQRTNCSKIKKCHHTKRSQPMSRLQKKSSNKKRTKKTN